MALLAVALVLCGPTLTLAFTPQSPEVQKMVRRAVRYLNRVDSYSDFEQVLVAIALIKAGEPKTNPVIEQVRKNCMQWCASESIIDGRITSIYELSVTGLFFCEYDPKLYDEQIRRLVRALEKRQKPFGGWGYPKPSQDWETGDTSMTQYAILFAWTAKATAAVDISNSSVRQVTNWLLRTQDPKGAWGYQGNDPGAFRRVQQSEVRHSLAAAGAGSLYICSGMLGFTSDQVAVAEQDQGLPPALKLIVKQAAAPQRVADGVIDRGILKKGIRDGDRWFKNNYQIKPEQYTLYYLYTLERYQSFRDAAEGRSRKEPGWYNDGVRLLKRTQESQGNWDIPGGNGRVVDTAFGILFLLRSTQKAIAKADDEFGGLLVAGRGIPTTTGKLKMKDGQIVTSAFQGSSKSLLEILENETHPDFDSLTSTTNIPIATDPKVLAIQQSKMQRLVRAERFETRYLAVRTLAKIHSLDNVPFLIFALTDPDARIVVAARDGLRSISRKFAGFGMPAEPTTQQREQAIEQWKAWYKDLRPNAQFED